MIAAWWLKVRTQDASPSLIAWMIDSSTKPSACWFSFCCKSMALWDIASLNLCHDGLASSPMNKTSVAKRNLCVKMLGPAGRMQCVFIEYLYVIKIVGAKFAAHNWNVVRAFLAEFSVEKD